MLGVKDSMLEELVHKQLGSIAFVRDHPQVDLGDARFNAFA
jgi:hypothetical protein